MVAEDLDRAMEIAQSLKDAPQWWRAIYLAALDPTATVRRIAMAAVDPQTARVTGFLVASVLPPEAELEMIAVATEAQRTGTGRQLMATLVEALRSQGVSEAILEVRASNQAALGLYRTLGWCETGRRPRYYADPEEDAVLMQLQIG